MPPQTYGTYVIDEDISRTDWERVHAWLSGSYWSPGIERERVERAARHSALVLGAYINGDQAGYLRVISDTVRWAYICDVWVDEGHRKKGLARAMVRYALEHPNMASVKWVLTTKDAQGVYGKLGFEPLTQPEQWMIRKTGLKTCA